MISTELSIGVVLLQIATALSLQTNVFFQSHSIGLFNPSDLCNRHRLCVRLPCRSWLMKDHRTETSQGSKWSDLSLEDVRRMQDNFSNERDWEQHHTPRNLALAMVGEVGEICECFQWKKDPECAPGLPGWSPKDKQHLGEELSDVLIYLVRLADRCGVDLPSAIEAKFKKNAEKYPATLVKGSSAKYTAYVGKRPRDADGADADADGGGDATDGAAAST